MASNFHNILGILVVGVDVHKGLQILSLPPFPMLFPELVCAHPFALGPNWKTTVHINGVPSVVLGHTPLVLWPHLPIIPENLFWPLDMLFGEHTCWLPRGSVFIEGETSTCCVAAGVSVNLDCWEWGKLPSDLVLQYATVMTSPSLSDFLYGALRAVFQQVAEKAFGKAFGKIFKKVAPKLSKLASKKLGRITKAIDKLPQKMANKLTRKGLGYQAAKKLGSPFAKQVARKFPELSKRALGGRSKSFGKQLTQEFLKRAGLKSDTVKSIAKKAVGWDPTRTLDYAAGRSGKGGGPLPIKGWQGAGTAAEGIPLWDKIHGGVQVLHGGK